MLGLGFVSTSCWSGTRNTPACHMQMNMASAWCMAHVSEERSQWKFHMVLTVNAETYEPSSKPTNKIAAVSCNRFGLETFSPAISSNGRR
jgi:hypothetical protein